MKVRGIGPLSCSTSHTCSNPVCLTRSLAVDNGRKLLIVFVGSFRSIGHTGGTNPTELWHVTVQYYNGTNLIPYESTRADGQSGMQIHTMHTQCNDISFAALGLAIITAFFEIFHYLA